jgi:hypothetical protein
MSTIQDATDADMRSPPDLGVTAQLELDNLKTKPVNDAKLRLSFHHDCRAYLAAMAKKLIQRSPLKYELIEQVG